ncbi:MAG: hypothetical protein H7836_10080 [Magnetococcus sp. YQC-3]|nr:hypothetical protein [Magnetococcales bacterium]
MDKNGIREPVLTEKQRFWLEHWQRCQATPGTIKEYATTHELSLPAMYFWRRELITRGLLEEVRRRVRFRKLAVLPEERPMPFRILLPNGVVVEWADSCGRVESLLRMAASLP